MAALARSDLWIQALQGDDPCGALACLITKGEGGRPDDDQDRTAFAIHQTNHANLCEVPNSAKLGVVCNALRHNDAVLAEALQLLFKSQDFQHFSREATGMHYPLVCASANGCSLAVAVLLSNNANPDQADPDGRCALLRAAERGHAKVARELLKHGADSGATSKAGSWTALHLAADAGYEAVVTVLVEHGADIVPRTDSGVTPLLQAAVNGRCGCASVLLKAGAQTEDVDRYGYTALLRAAEHGHTGVVHVLLDAGANVNATDHLKCTALIWACWGGHLSSVALLLARGAATANENSHKLTALMSAAGRGFAAVVLCLLVLTRPEIADHEASLAAAVSFNHPVVVTLLETERLPAWSGKRLRLAAAGRAPLFTSIVRTLLRSGLDNPELYPKGLLVETAQYPPVWLDSPLATAAPGTAAMPSLLMERLMRACEEGWSMSAHCLYPLEMQMKIWTVMLINQRFDNGSEAQVELWLPWELWIYGILLFVRR